MLHIIGLMVHLSTTHSAKLSFLSRILKREAKELKNYCVELGLRMEVCHTKDRESGKEFDDHVAHLKRQGNVLVVPVSSEDKTE